MSPASVVHAAALSAAAGMESSVQTVGVTAAVAEGGRVLAALSVAVGAADGTPAAAVP
jgi:hypothetical protein